PISRSGHTFQTNLYPTETQVVQEKIAQNVFPLNGVKHSIIVPPSSAAPEFHGQHSESPTQFLIRVQEYAESVHAWDRPTLLNGISQFLRDSALEWYCQLRISNRRPQTWIEFTDLFLAQFNSPIRKAKQEQEWHECKQRENETVSEFLIRLRALWAEVKPKETETELIKHLFCKMRNELIGRIGLTHWTSFDDIIIEAQKVEEILYCRNKEQPRAAYMKQVAPQDDISYHNTRLNGDNINQTKRRPTRTQKYDATIKIEQETSCDQQSKVTTDLDEECDANGFWPVGTESWHIHEIKPQRDVFTRSTIPDSIITAQQTSMESQSEISEKSSDFQIGTLCDESVPEVDELNYLQSQKIMQSRINEVKPVEQISQNVESSVQLSFVVPAVSKQQQSYLETPEKVGLFLFSILMRVGIAYNMASSPDTYHAQPPTINAEFTTNSMPLKCSRNYVKKSSSFIKTIEILRDLESLLIYGIT
ncbi:unnamed protein product, partial [Rotaria magnacalcarata]